MAHADTPVPTPDQCAAVLASSPSSRRRLDDQEACPAGQYYTVPFVELKDANGASGVCKASGSNAIAEPYCQGCSGLTSKVWNSCDGTPTDCADTTFRDANIVAKTCGQICTHESTCIGYTEWWGTSGCYWCYLHHYGGLVYNPSFRGYLDGNCISASSATTLTTTLTAAFDGGYPNGHCYKKVQDPCTDCAAGQFKGSVGIHACTLCPAGKYTASTGATACDTCVGATEGATSCAGVPTGVPTPTSSPTPIPSPVTPAPTPAPTPGPVVTPTPCDLGGYTLLGLAGGPTCEHSGHATLLDDRWSPLRCQTAMDACNFNSMSDYSSTSYPHGCVVASDFGGSFWQPDQSSVVPCGGNGYLCICLTIPPTSPPTPSPTPSPTLAPTPSPTPAPTPSPTPAPTPSPTASPTPSPTAPPTPSPTPSPTSSPTPPTASPTPLPTPAPGESCRQSGGTCTISVPTQAQCQVEANARGLGNGLLGNDVDGIAVGDTSFIPPGCTIYHSGVRWNTNANAYGACGGSHGYDCLCVICDAQYTPSPTASPTPSPTSSPSPAPTPSPTPPTSSPTASPTAAPTPAPPACRQNGGVCTTPVSTQSQCQAEATVRGMSLSTSNNANLIPGCSIDAAGVYWNHYAGADGTCGPFGPDCLCVTCVAEYTVAITAVPTPAPTHAPTPAPPTPSPTPSPTAAPTPFPACAPGNYAAVAGTACAECPAGKYSTSSGATLCTLCLAGRHYNWGGYTGTTVPADSCKQCPSGKFAEAGADACSRCPPGRAGAATAGSTSVSVCDLCPAGKYSPGASQWAACGECYTGQYSSSSGAAWCDPCAAGHYSPSTGAVSCIACAAGQYSTSTQATTCITCASGQYSASSGATVCDGTVCAAGKFGPVGSTGDTAATCAECAAGHYSPIGAAACIEITAAPTAAPTVPPTPAPPACRQISGTCTTLVTTQSQCLAEATARGAGFVEWHQGQLPKGCIISGASVKFNSHSTAYGKCGDLQWDCLCVTCDPQHTVAPTPSPTPSPTASPTPSPTPSPTSPPTPPTPAPTPAPVTTPTPCASAGYTLLGLEGGPTCEDSNMTSLLADSSQGTSLNCHTAQTACSTSGSSSAVQSASYPYGCVVARDLGASFWQTFGGSGVPCGGGTEEYLCICLTIPPTPSPTPSPTLSPTPAPTPSPTPAPTPPTPSPTRSPSSAPTAHPTPSPTPSH